MTTRALSIAVGIIVSSLVWSHPGWSTSTNPYRLAFSQKLGAEVFAVPNSGGSWCASAVNLKVSLSNGSPLLSSMVKADRAAFAAKLGTVLARECPAATAATVRFVTGPAQSQVDSQAMARGPSGWASVAMASPAAAPSAQPAPPSPPAAAAASSVAIAPQPEAKPNTLQIGRGYMGLLVKVLRDDPNLANSDAAIRRWAQLRFPREYEPVQNQEFALQPLLAKAKADLKQTIADSDPDRIEVRIPTQFQTYDFSAHRFPVAITGQPINLATPCCPPEGLPNSFEVTVSGLDAINGFPMDEDAAKSFEQRRTHFNSVDRSIWLVAIVKLAPGPYARHAYVGFINSATLVDATFVGGTIYGDQNCTQQVYALDEAEIARQAAAKAAAALAAEDAENAKRAEAQRQQMAAQAEAQREQQAREAEAQHQQMAAQRDSFIQQLQSSSDSVKLANFILPGPIDTAAHLDSLRAARTTALIAGHAVDVTMLVQTYSSGSEGVTTKWPGHLAINVPNGKPLKSSSWYIVRGSLTVPAGDDLPDANLAATAIYACQKDQCADATDAAAIVDHKLAAGN